ncbi:MAG: acyl-CoA dehydratase activase-related protein [Desulfotomaculales bacterium]
MPTVALPRAMAYYYMYPFFRTFFHELGVDVAVSPPTTKQTMEKMEFCPTDEPCLAVKLLFAHAKELLDAGHQDLVIPCLVSLEPHNFCCPKFIGIPYMVQNALKNGARIHVPRIDMFQGKKHWQETFVAVGRHFGALPHKVLQALDRAWQVQHRFDDALVEKKLTTVEGYRLLESGRLFDTVPAKALKEPVIGVVGHPYVLYDSFTLDLLAEFRKYGTVLTAEMVPAAQARREVGTLLEGERLWNFEARILGAGLYYLRNRLVDKLALVGSFECGPESVIESYLEEEAARRGIPFLLLTLDEHTGEAGLVTRIEAFMDVTPSRNPSNREAASPLTTPGLRAEKFVIGLPTMGHLDVAIRSALADCGVESIRTPAASKEVLELGKLVSPEFVCLPFVITLGQMRWLLEHGATRLLMVGGKGKCRLGWYAQIQEQLLRRLGYDFEMIIIDSPLPLRERWSQFRQTLRRATNNASWLRVLRALYAGYHKMAAIDEAEKICHRLRAFEQKQGTIDRHFKRFVRKIEEASGLDDVWRLMREFREQADSIETEDTNPVRVRVLGEIWVVLEAYVNMQIERLLGSSADPRVWVDREISCTTWFHQHIFPTREAVQRRQEIKEAAAPYLGVEVGGHGQISVGLTALAKREGIDGVIHLMPFTCMPEIVAQNIIVRISQELDIPVLTFIITDQTGEAGFETRVEAFLDILKDRRDARLVH